MTKETIYLDNDDEIASIIDKVQSSNASLIAMVLPKRCTVLQSLVNMKILQRTAKSSSKKVVLITTEAALLPVAGVAGVYVAKNLQSKPILPQSPKYEDEQIDTVNEAEDDPDIDKTKTVGELAAVAAVATAAGAKDDETIELGEEPDEKPGEKPKKAKNKDKKNKKLSVPNFDSFRLKLFAVIGGIILLVVLWFLATNVLPRAKVTIKTENKVVAVDLTATASQSAKSIDADNLTLPAETKTIEKTETKKFAATGERDLGTKATGEVTLSIACSAVDGSPPTIPAGTGVSTGNLTFITQNSVSLTTPSFAGGCKFIDKVGVIAQNAGDQYNISSGRSFTVAGFSSVAGSNSTSMGGGTSRVVKIISQTDCDNAKNELLNVKTDDYKNQLAAQLSAAGLTPVKDTFNVVQGTASCTPPVGQEATEGTATVTLKMTMVGVNTSGLNQLIENDVKKQIEGSQTIFDTGIKTANITVKERKNNNDIVIKVQTDAQTGIKQDSDAITKMIAGKKRGDSLTLLKAQPGVSDVKIEYKPFWVSRNPTNVKHITIVFENNDGK